MNCLGRGSFSGVLLLAALALCGCERTEDPVVETQTGQAAESQGPSIIFIQSPSADPKFGVYALSEDQRAAITRLDPEALSSLVEVYAGDVDDTPPMLGKVSVSEDTGQLQFEPRYPLKGGVAYRVVYHPSRLPVGAASAPDVVEVFEIAKPEPGPETVVEHVYPTADRLPENQLKFYLHFSAPMSRGEAYRRVHLLDVEGNEVDAPFLELGEELWDPGLTRFTLLFDPGRIKRGLKPREDVGPVLEAGRRYTLLVDRDWLDADGRPLAGDVRKTFDVLPADNAPLEVDAWRIEAPPAGTTDPLVVRFGEPLDHSLLERVVRVVGPDGQRAGGTIETSDKETCWRFTPNDAWQAGGYRLVADTTLEDLAGNSIGRAFDVDVFEPVQRRITSQTVAIDFSIANP